MNRKIVDFTKVPPELKKRLKEEFPDGFEDADVVRFQNAKGEEVKAIRMEDGDTVYLIKFERKLATINDEFMDDEYEDEPDFDIDDIEDDDEDDEE